MDEGKLKRVGKYMSLLLRHKPEKENLEIEGAGWVKVLELIGALNITKEELDWIVESNSKKRFEYSDDKEYIRATQGHTFEIDLELHVVKPPDVLFHGTTMDNYNAIMKEGLQKMQRHHVHLTEDSKIAEDVGLRYAKQKDKLWIICILAEKMFKDGYVFYETSNNVYLTDHVPSEYFNLIK